MEVVIGCWTDEYIVIVDTLMSKRTHRQERDMVSLILYWHDRR